MGLLERTIDIGILVYPQCMRSGVVAPMDVFDLANSLALFRPAAQRVRFKTHWVSARGTSQVRLGGLQVDTEALVAEELDALLVPGIDHVTTEELIQALESLGAESQALGKFAASGRLLLASCSGICLLASTGAMDGRQATISWWLSAFFRAYYPKVKLQAEELVVRDGVFVSSGGGAAYIDLALWLIGHFAGEEMRQITANILMMDSQRSSQVPYITGAMRQSAGLAVIERARAWLNQRLEQPWTLAELAQHCRTSQRTLLRRFQEVIGLSPIQYSQQLRIERAKALLESTRLSLQEITERCGYSDVSTFSKIFKRWAQVTPRDYRKRFGLRV